MRPFITSGDDYLGREHRIHDSSTRNPLEEEPAVSIGLLSRTRVLISGREALLFHGLY